MNENFKPLIIPVAFVLLAAALFAWSSARGSQDESALRVTSQQHVSLTVI